MRLKRFIAGFLLTLLLAPPLAGLATPALAAEKYAIDPVHSHIGFAVRHMMVSLVKGQFRELSGEILFDEKDIMKSSVSVAIQAASLDTNNQQRDTHLKSADFIYAEQHPQITFASKRIQKQGEGYVAIGDLTIRGVTREIALPFTLFGPIKDAQGRMRLGVQAETTLNRLDYNASWSRVIEGGGLGALVVGNEVRVELAVEAVKVEPRPQP